jgi:two-component system OmpR family response regulator/two-component system response regulator RstA
MLRKSTPNKDDNKKQLRFGTLLIDKSSRKATLKDQELDLTTHEFELLWLLAEEAGEPMNRDDIHKKMIGREYDGLDRTVDVRVSRLRKKLQDNLEKPYRLVTVWGKGYMFCPDAWEDE